MKVIPKLVLILCVFYLSPSQAWWFASTNSTVDSQVTQSDKEHNEWLKKRFSKQHQQLIPIVAVADIFYSCNKARQLDNVDYKLSYLVTEMDKNVLAEKLNACLAGDSMQSDVALNFGLFGCFEQQLAHLPVAEQKEKMQLVKKAVASISHEERKKSFTQCVTEQSIHYLK